MAKVQEMEKDYSYNIIIVIQFVYCIARLSSSSSLSFFFYPPSGITTSSSPPYHPALPLIAF
jgi:hypothetical protein